MDKLVVDDFTVGYLEYTREATCSGTDGCKYLIASATVSDLEAKKALSRSGYVFHDRVLRLGIDIPASMQLRRKRCRKPDGIKIRKAEEFTDEMYRMACSVFRTDRRFHLDYGYNQKLADRVIKAWMDRWKGRKLQVMQAFYKGEMTGFVIFDTDSQSQSENVLGVTAPGICGMASAYPLYSDLLDLLGQGGCRKYYGMVSTENAASINLHIQLGAEVCSIVDRFILRKRGDSNGLCENNFRSCDGTCRADA